MKSFDEFLEKRFPDSRRKAYYLMAIHENLSRVPKQQLREIGWSKATELAKVARREGERFESQLKVIEQALETAGLMLGSDRSRGYCLETICADFLAGVNLENGEPEALLLAIHRLMGMLTPTQRQQIFERVQAMP